MGPGMPQLGLLKRPQQGTEGGTLTVTTCLLPRLVVWKAFSLDIKAGKKSGQLDSTSDVFILGGEGGQVRTKLWYMVVG